jgi:hypothetical protein
VLGMNGFGVGSDLENSGDWHLPARSSLDWF